MTETRAAGGGASASKESGEWLQQLHTIEGLGTSLGQESSVEQICRLTGEVAASLMAHDQIRIYLVDRKTRNLVPSYLSPSTREDFSALTKESLSASAASGIAGQTLKKARALIVGDAGPGEVGLAADQTAAVTVSAVAVPVLFRDEPLAVIEVVRLGSRQYSKNHSRLLQVLAGQMALSITNARLVERLAA